MTKHHVKITSEGVDGHVELNGQNISGALQRATVELGANSPVYVNLSLNAPTLELESGEVEVRIPDSARKALIALGWTPPQEDR